MLPSCKKKLASSRILKQSSAIETSGIRFLLIGDQGVMLCPPSDSSASHWAQVEDGWCNWACSGSSLVERSASSCLLLHGGLLLDLDVAGLQQRN